MPLKWFTCPDNERIEVRDCLAEGGCRRENRCATRSYLKLVSNERVWTGKPSTTQLINGTMLAWLRLTRDYAVSPDDRAFMIHGTKGHGVLQASDDDYSILEEKLEGDDTPETGIFDVLEFENDRAVLVDYKTSGSYKVQKALGFYVDKEPTGTLYKSGKRKGEPRTQNVLKRDDSRIDRREWELQLNKYRLELEKRGFMVSEMRVMCIVRDGNTYIARSRGVYRNIYYFRIRRIPDSEVLVYFARKRHALFVALHYGWDNPCSGEENWAGVRCGRYCEVSEYCSYGKYLTQEKEVEDMPIKGLSEVRRLPRQGKISLGKMLISAKGNNYPSEVDHFILRPGTPNESEVERLVGRFHELYGEEPKAIKIMLPVSDRELIFPQYYKRYGKTSGLKCKGDGETAVCMSDKFTEGLKVIGEHEGLSVVECKGDSCPFQQKKPAECTKVATLQVLLPELEGAGVWQITTGSFNSIVNINSCLDYIETVAGRAHMIPLTLERRPQDIQHDGQKRTHYPLHIDMAIELKELMRWAAIDEKKVLLELPGIAEEREDVIFEQTSESAIHDTPVSALPPAKAEPVPEKPKPTGEVNYTSLLNHLAETLSEDVEVVKKFVADHLGAQGKAVLGMKQAVEDAVKMGQLVRAYKRWIGKAIDSQSESAEQPEGEPVGETPTPPPPLPPPETLIDEMQKSEIKELVPLTNLGKTIGTQKFKDWWTKYLNAPAGTQLFQLTFEQGELLIQGLRTLAEPNMPAEGDQDQIDF